MDSGCVWALILEHFGGPWRPFLRFLGILDRPWRPSKKKKHADLQVQLRRHLAIQIPPGPEPQFQKIQFRKTECDDFPQNQNSIFDLRATETKTELDFLLLVDALTRPGPRPGEFLTPWARPPHGNLWFYLSRTHTFQKRRKAKIMDSGLVFDLVLGYMLVLGGPFLGFWGILDRLLRCSKKRKNKDEYDDNSGGISRPGGSQARPPISKDILKDGFWILEFWILDPVLII